MKLAKREYQPLKEGEYSIRKDEVFKIVFGSNERSEFLKAFLESILHKKITRNFWGRGKKVCGLFSPVPKSFKKISTNILKKYQCNN